MAVHSGYDGWLIVVFAETWRGWRSLSRCCRWSLRKHYLTIAEQEWGRVTADMLSNPGCFHGLSSFLELGGTVCCPCQQINIYISCSPIQRVQKPKEKTTIRDLRGCQHYCSFLVFLYAYTINAMLDVTITTYESQFYLFPLVFEHFRL